MRLKDAFRKYFPSATNQLPKERKRARTLRLETLERRNLLAAIVMSDHEQLLLELVNRARANPSAEAALYGIDLNQGLAAGTITTSPKEPLSPNQSLINAAGAHSQDMLNQDYFSHTNLAGQTSSQRMIAAGYTGVSTGENISWGGQYPTAVDQILHVYQRHESLFRSPGHRMNILRETFDELGNGVRYGVFTTGGQNYNASMVTENFGRSNNQMFITGVAFTDNVIANNFYNVGESISNLTVRATSSTGAVYETVTGNSGGYRLVVPAGTYTVRFFGGGYTGEVVKSGITIVDRNVKVDLDANTDQWAVSAPATPTNVGPSSSTAVGSPTILTNGTPTFQWSSVSNATSYQLWVAPVGVSNGVINVVTSSTSFTPTTPLAVGSYRYVIRAINSGGESPFSQQFYFTIAPPDVPPPGIPTNVGPSNSTDSSAPTRVTTFNPTFQWNPSLHASTYQLWVAPVGNPSGVINAIVSGTSYVSPVPLAQGSYRYVIRAINVEGETSPFSQQYFFNISPDIPVPAVPVNLAPLTGTAEPIVISNRTPTFQWSQVDHASNYQLWVAPVGSPSGVIFATTTGTSFTPTAPLPLGSYRYTVRAVNSEGEASDFSQQSYFDLVADVPVPAVPVPSGTLTSNLWNSPTVTTNRTPTFKWNSVANASQYELWVAPVGSSSGVIHHISSGTSHTSATALPVGSYRYVIRAINSEGEASNFSPFCYFDVV